MMGKKTICVDFDHTITQTDDEYAFGSETPNPEVIEWVRDRYFEGHTIIVWTARQWDDAPKIVGRLTEWGVFFHGVRCAKGGGDVYVDDKAVNVKDANWAANAQAVMSRQQFPGEDPWADGGSDE